MKGRPHCQERRDFPGGPVAKITHFQCRGPRFKRAPVRELDPMCQLKKNQSSRDPGKEVFRRRKQYVQRP